MCESNGTAIFYSPRVTVARVSNYSNKTDVAHYKIICIINDVFTREREAVGDGRGGELVEKTNSYRAYSVRIAFVTIIYTRRHNGVSLLPAM